MRCLLEESCPVQCFRFQKPNTHTNGEPGPHPHINHSCRPLVPRGLNPLLIATKQRRKLVSCLFAILAWLDSLQEGEADVNTMTYIGTLVETVPGGRSCVCGQNSHFLRHRVKSGKASRFKRSHSSSTDTIVLSAFRDPRGRCHHRSWRLRRSESLSWRPRSLCRPCVERIFHFQDSFLPMGPVYNGTRTCKSVQTKLALSRSVALVRLAINVNSY